jgi:hypothetical protein
MISYFIFVAFLLARHSLFFKAKAGRKRQTTIAFGEYYFDFLKIISTIKGNFGVDYWCPFIFK